MSEIVLCGDALDQLKTLESESVDTCVTSPPYYCQRDYGVDGQLGLEETPEEYIEKMVEVFREVRRVLRPGGTLWVNIGDSYCAPKTSSCSQASSTLGGGKTTQVEASKRPSKKPSGDIKQKDLIGVPWMLAFALRADGWYLRQDIIWEKPNAMPESVKDRCTKSHEHIFLLAKQPRYYFDHGAIREPAVKGAAGSRFNTGKTGEHQMGRASKKERVDSDMRAKRDVWRVATQPFKGNHFAPFPEKLVEPCVLAGCPEGGTVLDPFTGSGTTGVVAKKLGRNFVGIELNPEYHEMATDRINSTERSFEQVKLQGI